MRRVNCLPLYRGSGLKFLLCVAFRVACCLPLYRGSGLKYLCSAPVETTIYVFLCIEEVDWNTNPQNWKLPGRVFLCIEEVDWNVPPYRYTQQSRVFLCIEEVDWNTSGRNTTVFRSCLPLYRGSGLKSASCFARASSRCLPLYRGSGLKYCFPESSFWQRPSSSV